MWEWRVRRQGRYTRPCLPNMNSHRSRRPWSDRLQLVSDLPPPFHELVVCLQADEEAFRHSKVTRETQVGVGGDGALAKHNLIDAARGHANRVRERGLRQRHWL